MNPQKIKNYVIKRVLGKGSFAIVYLAIDEQTQQEVAIKEINTSEYSEDDERCQKQLECFKLEADIMKNVRHQNIIRMIDDFKLGENIYMVLEYCPNGTLTQFIKSRNGRVPEKEAQPIIVQILSAMKVLNDNKIVHRDLKTENILIDKQNDPKVADFGFARYFQGASLMKSFCGTPYTMAPEILTNQAYSFKCDIWSLGVIIYNMLCGMMPFRPKPETLENLIRTIQKSPLEFPQQIQLSNEIKDLLAKMLTVDPEKRITFEAIDQHPWVSTPKKDQQALTLASRTTLSRRGPQKQPVEESDEVPEDIARQLVRKLQIQQEGKIFNLKLVQAAITRFKESKPSETAKQLADEYLDLMNRTLTDIQICIRDPSTQQVVGQGSEPVIDFQRKMHYLVTEIYQILIKEPNFPIQAFNTLYQMWKAGCEQHFSNKIIIDFKADDQMKILRQIKDKKNTINRANPTLNKQDYPMEFASEALSQSEKFLLQTMLEERYNFSNKMNF